MNERRQIRIMVWAQKIGQRDPQPNLQNGFAVLGHFKLRFFKKRINLALVLCGAKWRKLVKNWILEL